MGKTFTISQVCLLKKRSEKKGGGVDCGWRDLFMLLGKLGVALWSRITAGEGGGRGTGRGPRCAFLPEGPVRFPETWAGGQSSRAEWG